MKFLAYTVICLALLSASLDFYLAFSEGLSWIAGEWAVAGLVTFGVAWQVNRLFLQDAAKTR
jgi:hypothetical protein